jgi:hypothetical protein
MKVSRIVLAGLLGSVAAAAVAQQPKVDLSGLPEVMKSGKWKDIDVAKLDLLEHVRALLLLNDVFDDIGGSTRAEADLMSQFIDAQQLGPKFASSPPPPPAPAPLTCEDALKVAVVMLRGPLSSSAYATNMGDVKDENFLHSYLPLYEPTCRRKFADIVEARHQLDWLAYFLQSNKLIKQYQDWVPGEIQRRQQAYEAQMRQKRAGHLAQEQQAKQAQEQRAAEAKEEKQKQKAQQEQAAIQMQQAMAAAQQAQAGQQSAASGGGDDWYPGWCYGGVSNLEHADWWRDAAYRGAANADVHARMTGWHGAAAGVGRR